MNSFNLELQLKNTEFAIKNKLKDLLTELRGLKYLTTLVIEFEKIESDDTTIYIFFSNSKSATVINANDIDYVFKSIYVTIISNIRKSFGKGSG